MDAFASFRFLSEWLEKVNNFGRIESLIRHFSSILKGVRFFFLSSRILGTLERRHEFFSLGYLWGGNDRHDRTRPHRLSAIGRSLIHPLYPRIYIYSISSNISNNIAIFYFYNNKDVGKLKMIWSWIFYNINMRLFTIKI